MPISGLSEYEQDKVLRELARREGHVFKPFKTLEELLISEEGFGLTTATKLQRQICKLLEGRELSIKDKELLAAMGVEKLPKAMLASGTPEEVIILAAVRSAKSMIAAATAIWASQTVDFSGLKEGEIPRYPIFSLEVDNAQVILGHLTGALQKPRLRGLLIPAEEVENWEEVIDAAGKRDNLRTLHLWNFKHEHPCEIRISAGKRAGASGISRWLFGATLDEAPRMVGASEGVVNYDDQRRGMISRLLPGATLLSIGSPWMSFGPIYDIKQSHHGRPTKARVVLTARGDQMNPFWWTKKRLAELKEKDPIAYKTDGLGEFADAEETLFPAEIVEASTRKELILPFNSRAEYRASMDPATRGNAWTFCISTKMAGKKVVAFAEEWIGSTVEPLRPRQVLEEIQKHLTTYKLNTVFTDQWSSDAIKDLADEIGFTVIEETLNNDERVDAYLSLSTEMRDGRVEFPPDAQLTRDFRLVKKRPKQHGVSIYLPTTTDGRHCDYCPAVILGLRPWLKDVTPEKPAFGTPAYSAALEKQIEEDEDIRFEEAKGEQWWEKDPYEVAYE